MKRKSTGVTRRQLAAAIAAAPALAQAPPPAQPDDYLAAAREQWKQTSATLRKFEVHQLLEPGFIFRP